jgi:hypothetical protein
VACSTKRKAKVQREADDHALTAVNLAERLQFNSGGVPGYSTQSAAFRAPLRDRVDAAADPRAGAIEG